MSWGSGMEGATSSAGSMGSSMGSAGSMGSSAGSTMGSTAGSAGSGMSSIGGGGASGLGPDISTMGGQGGATSIGGGSANGLSPSMSTMGGQAGGATTIGGGSANRLGPNVSSMDGGMSQMRTGAPPISGNQLWGYTPQSAPRGEWYSRAWDAIKGHLNDYNAGERQGFAGAVDSALDGNYTKTAGYIGNKVQSMGGQGAGNPTAMIQLPGQPPQDNSMQNRYAQIYQQHNRVRGI